MFGHHSAQGETWTALHDLTYAFRSRCLPARKTRKPVMAPIPPYDRGHDDYMFDDASSLRTISSRAGTLQQPSTLASSGSNASVPPSNASFYVARNEASIPASTVMASNAVEKAQTDSVCVSAKRKTEKIIGKRGGQGEKNSNVGGEQGEGR